MRGLFVRASTSCTEYLSTGSNVHSLDMMTSHLLQFTRLLSSSVQYSEVALQKNVSMSYTKYATSLIAESKTNLTEVGTELLHCIVKSILYQTLPEPDWLVPGDHRYWLHTRLDPCWALNLMCSQQLVSDHLQASAVLPSLVRTSHLC